MGSRVSSLVSTRSSTGDSINGQQKKENGRTGDGHPGMPKPRLQLGRSLSLTRTPSNASDRYNYRAEFLQRVSSTSTNLQVYVTTIVLEVMRCLSADRCSIFFVDEVRKAVWCVGSVDMEPFSMPWDQGIVGRVAQNGKMINLADAHTHEAFDPTIERKTGYAVKALLAVPIKKLMGLRRTVGVIQVLNKVNCTSDRFTDEDLEELHKIIMLISESFYRQRWKALQSSGSYGDSVARSMIAATTGLPRGNSMEFSPVPTAEPSPRHEVGASAEVIKPDSIILRANSQVALERMSWNEYEAGALVLAAEPMLSLEFNVFAWAPQDLLKLTHETMLSTGCTERCFVPPGMLEAWSLAVKQRYRDNPFHNWQHAVSTFHMCSYQLRVTKDSPHLRSLDVFGLLVASLTHDLDHPGRNNQFLIDEQDELALRYNDISPLENHHAYLACELLRKPSTAIGSGLDSAAQAILRRIIIRSILDTDMCHHDSLCNKILDHSCASWAEINSAEERQTRLSIIMHCADLSGQVLAFELASQWESRVAQEFVAQAEAELSAGRTPAPFMHFNMEDIKTRGKLQRDFIDFVLLPLWDPYTQLVPILRPCYDNLVRNRELYDARAVTGLVIDMDEEALANAPTPLPTGYRL